MNMATLNIIPGYCLCTSPVNCYWDMQINHIRNKNESYSGVSVSDVHARDSPDTIDYMRSILYFALYYYEKKRKLSYVRSYL